MPARFDLGVDLAQQQRQFWLALEVDGKRLGLPIHQREHLARDAVDQDLRAKRGIFGGARQGQQKVAQTGQIHGGFSRKG